MRWGYALFFLMLFAPAALKLPKIILIGVIGVIVVASILRTGRLRLQIDVVRLAVVFTAAGIFYTILGVARGNPGALEVARVFVLWPWVYLMFMAGISNVEGLKRTMLVSTIVISLYSFQFILHSLGGPGFKLGLGESFSLHGFSLYPLNSLIFLVPFCIASKGKWYKIAAGMGLVLVLLSGRKGLMLAVALSFPLTLLLRYYTDRKVVKPVLLVGGLCVLAFLLIDVRQIWDLFSLSLDPRYSLGASIRAEQASDLLSEWMGRPIFGSGLGANLHAARGQAMTIEGEANTWSYELQYLQLLANTGVVGVLLYGSGIGWVYLSGLRHLDRMGPVLIGMTCFLLANATNPYLLKYDFLWVIFLPVAMVNFYDNADSTSGDG